MGLIVSVVGTQIILNKLHVWRELILNHCGRCVICDCGFAVHCRRDWS